MALSLFHRGVSFHLEYTLGAHRDHVTPVHVSDVVKNVVILKVFSARDLDDLVHHVGPKRWIFLVFSAWRQSRGRHMKGGLDRGKVVQALPRHKIAHPSHRWLFPSECNVLGFCGSADYDHGRGIERRGQETKARLFRTAKRDWVC